MSIRNDFTMPVLVLAILCLLVSGALAVGNRYTEPVIEQAAAMREEAARKEIIPQAESFIPVENHNLPKSVTEVFATSNNTGYIFVTITSGYGGDIKIICGISPGGKLIQTALIAQTETTGLGTVVFEKPYAGLFWGKDREEIQDIAAISGATITSRAFKKAIEDSFEAFKILVR
ncbi:MAG: FMN-binding protein [Treponema sp.]|nr:FMN-binding protein [Treponema sp.]